MHSAFFIGLICVWLAFMGFLISGGTDNHNTNPRTHAVHVTDSEDKVCAGPNLVYIVDNSFWNNNPQVVLTVLDSSECK